MTFCPALQRARTPLSTHRRSANPWVALIFLSLTLFMVVLDGAVLNIALPSAQHDLGFSDAGRQWVVTAYSLAFGGLLLLGGRVGDLLGRRRVLLIGLIGFAAASLFGGLATDLGMLLAARAVQGASGALLAPAALGAISATFVDGKDRARAFGVLSAVATAGGAIGLLLGGVLTQYLDWRWALYINIPLAALSFIGVMVTIREPKERAGRVRLDLPGALLGTAGITALVFGFGSAEQAGWASVLTIGMLAAAVVLLVAFVVLQKVGRDPLLPLEVLSERNRAAGLGSMALATIGMFAMFLFLSYYLQLVKGYSPVIAGLAFVPLALGQALGSTAIGAKLSARVRPRYLMAGGYIVSAAGLVMMVFLGSDSSLVYIVIAEFIAGLGIGTAFMPATSMSTTGVKPHHVGAASAMVSTAQQVGGSLGTSLLNTVAGAATVAFAASHHLQVGSPGALVHGFSIAFWGAVAALVAASVLSFVLSNAPRPSADAVRTVVVH